jgi:hypothetical protein
MMRHLSISRAWEDTQRIGVHDGRLIGAVALALVGFPVLVSGIVAPKGMMDQTVPGWGMGVGLIAQLVAVAGQLAIVRLAIGPSTTVGDAIAHGLKRMPVYVVAAIVIFLGAVLLAVPIAAILLATGAPLDEAALKTSPTFNLLALAYLCVAIFFAIRLVMMSPVTSAERVGPLKIIGRSWDLTRGNWWRLFGFLAVFLLGALVVMIAVAAAVGILVNATLGPVEPLSASAAVTALAQGLVSAAVTSLLAIMLARIYIQLAAPDSVSVPSSGA